MDSRQLRYFEAIFEKRSLTTAAGELRVAVSALSHHLSNLETELGHRLFHRKPRGLEPTAAGERLYTHAKAILRAMQAAERDVKASGGEVAGDVTIGMAYSAVKAIGVPLLQRILTDYPKLNLSLSESLSGATLLHLLAADVDMALVYNPPADMRLKSVPVLEESMVLIGLERIIGENGRPVAFHDTLDMPMIILRQGISARALVDDATLLKKLESKARFQMNSVQAIGGALIAGLGCAIGTRLFLQEYIESGALAVRPVVEPSFRARSISARWPSARHPTRWKPCSNSSFNSCTTPSIAGFGRPARSRSFHPAANCPKMCGRRWLFNLPHCDADSHGVQPLYLGGRQLDTRNAAIADA